jgi:glutamyl-tRNA synthetase
MKMRTRFAPSPTGFMHIGNLRTALYAYLFAKSNNGDFLIRIEDTDRERFVPGAIEKIYSTLDACGIVEDESPRKPGACGPYVQSERKEIYLNYAKKLVELGGAYLCFCGKKAAPNNDTAENIQKYDKHCASLSQSEIEANLAKGQPYVIRQNIPLSGKTTYHDMVFGDIVVDCADLEDNILIKSDGMPTYNFANVIDDHLMGITHVIRGTEYLSSTPKYNLLYESFGWKKPQYMHLTPIMKDERHKLSKRDGDANFEDFTSKGYLPSAIINYIALLGWSPKENIEKMTMSELIELFSVDGLTKSASIFDETKMKWLNGQYIRELSIEDFLKLSSPFFDKSQYGKSYDRIKLATVLHQRVDIFDEIEEKIALIENFNIYNIELFERQKLKATRETAKIALNSVILAFSELEAFDETVIRDTLASITEQTALKKGQVLWAVRVALTGKESTPGGAVETADILGKSESLRRLKFSLELLNSN